jgi:hypothetical protein
VKRLSPDTIRCPAGDLVVETIQGSGCRCRITRETLTEAENAGSLNNFCAGKYTQCPVWRREKEAIAERKRKQLHEEIASTDSTAERPA